MTNFEKIKQEISEMSLEEYAKYSNDYLCDKIPYEHCKKYGPTVNGSTISGPVQCEKCRMDWLKSETE